MKNEIRWESRVLSFSLLPSIHEYRSKWRNLSLENIPSACLVSFLSKYDRVLMTRFGISVTHIRTITKPTEYSLDSWPPEKSGEPVETTTLTASPPVHWFFDKKQQLTRRSHPAHIHAQFSLSPSPLPLFSYNPSSYNPDKNWSD